MSITRRCPWCAQDHPLRPSETEPGRLVAICSLLGRAYYNCKATFDVLLDSIPADAEAEIMAEIDAEIAEHRARMREEEE